MSSRVALARRLFAECLGTALLAGRTGISIRDLCGYVVAQCAGGVSGAVLANLVFDLPAVAWSARERAGTGVWLGEVVATAGLVLVIFALDRAGRGGAVPLAVGGYIGAAYWFTSSTSFANPAVTLGRTFSDTFAGIAPASVPGYVAAQLVGLVAGVATLAALYPVGPTRAVAARPPDRSTVQTATVGRAEA